MNEKNKSNIKPEYCKPQLVKYVMKENIAEYLLAHSTPNVLKCANNPPGCSGRRRGLFAPPPWG